MTDDVIPLEYVCARWAYSELLSAQPYYGSELNPREKLPKGCPSTNSIRLTAHFCFTSGARFGATPLWSSDYRVLLHSNDQLGPKSSSEPLMS